MKILFEFVGCVVAAVLAAGCGHAAPGAPASSAAASVPAHAAKIGDHAAEKAPDPGASIPWFAGSIEEAFATAAKENKPVFLFWSASWCPYCQDLKASVFPRADFLAKLKFFVPVNLDGDLPSAQKIGEDLHVSGYPTVLILRPDHTELARIAGGMDLSRYAEVLDTALGDVKPVKEILASLESSQVLLTPENCRRLAFNAWTLDPQNTDSTADLGQLGAHLALAAKRCPAAQTTERACLTILATAATTDAEEGALKLGKPPSKAAAALVADVNKLLGDTELAASVSDTLQELSTAYFLAARHDAPDAVRQLLDRWTLALERVSNDAHFSEGQRLAAIASELQVAKALTPDESVPPSLAKAARARLDEALSRKQDSYSRASIINAALDILETLNDPKRAQTMLQAEIKRANAPYYYMRDLAHIEETLGHKDAALQWMKRAYDESKGPATRFRYGATYVATLTRLSPNDAPTIRSAALSTINELDTSDALHNGTASRLQQLDQALRRWNKPDLHRDVIADAHAAIEKICRKIPEDDSTRITCNSFLS